MVTVVYHETNLLVTRHQYLEIYNMIRALVKPWPGARYLNTKGDIVVIDKMMSLDEIEALRIREGQNNR